MSEQAGICFGFCDLSGAEELLLPFAGPAREEVEPSRYGKATDHGNRGASRSRNLIGESEGQFAVATEPFQLTSQRLEFRARFCDPPEEAESLRYLTGGS
jgi:hypothetical protein